MCPETLLIELRVVSRLSLLLASDLTGTRSDFFLGPPDEPWPEIGVTNTWRDLEDMMDGVRVVFGEGVTPPPSPESVSL